MDSIRRRVWAAASAAWLAGLAGRAAAQGGAPASSAAPAAPAASGAGTGKGANRRIGIFSVLGETLNVSSFTRNNPTRLDTTSRNSLPAKGVGFDSLVAQELRIYLTRNYPEATLLMFNASANLESADQRRIAQSADRGALPGWIIDTIQAQQLTHIVLATHDRANAAMRTADNQLVGAIEVDGIGLHIDLDYQTINVQTGDRRQGALGPHVVVALRLFDVEEARVLRRVQVNEQRLIGPPDGEVRPEGPWAYMSSEQKIRMLRQLTSQGTRKVVAELFEGFR